MIKSKIQEVKTSTFTDKFNKPKRNLDTNFGLPKEICFCSKCVISNQRPNSAVEFQHTSSSKKKTINFDENRVCDACHVAEAKKIEVNWKDREKELIDLCNKHRKDDGTYDCLVPGSGGKDSFYQSHVLKYKYGMNPLTVTWAPHMYTEWGWKNFQAWLESGFDNYLLTPNPRMHRLMTRLAVENLFHPFQPFMFGQKAYAPKMAANMDISLIFYGENESEYGNPVKDNQSAQRDWSYFSGDDQSEIHLGGVSVKDLMSNYGVKKVDLDPYLPINPEKLIENNMEIH